MPAMKISAMPIHFAAERGNLAIVRKLIEHGADPNGAGDTHELSVIGWATCWDGCDDGAHRAIADFLVSRGARHHIFSAIAMNLADEVRRILREAPARAAGIRVEVTELLNRSVAAAGAEFRCDLDFIGVRYWTRQRSTLGRCCTAARWSGCTT